MEVNINAKKVFVENQIEGYCIFPAQVREK